MEDKTTSVYELVASVILGAYSAVMITYAWLNPIQTNATGMKSYTFPVIIYCIMLACCLAVIVKNRILAQKRKKAYRGLTEQERSRLSPDAQKAFRFELPDKRVLLTIAAIFLYAAMWQVIGFTVSTFLFIIAAAKILKRDAKLWRCAAVSLAADVLVYVVFVQVFSISLPETFLRGIL